MPTSIQSQFVSFIPKICAASRWNKACMCSLVIRGLKVIPLWSVGENSSRTRW
jgi:hypothetical protein